MAPAPVSVRMHYHRTTYSYLFQRLIACNHERCKRRPRCAMGKLTHTFLRHAVVMSNVNRNLNNDEGLRFRHHSRAPVHTSRAPLSPQLHAKARFKSGSTVQHQHRDQFEAIAPLNRTFSWILPSKMALQNIGSPLSS